MPDFYLIKYWQLTTQYSNAVMQKVLQEKHFGRIVLRKRLLLCSLHFSQNKANWGSKQDLLLEAAGRLYCCKSLDLANGSKLIVNFQGFYICYLESFTVVAGTLG